MTWGSYPGFRMTGDHLIKGTFGLLYMCPPLKAQIIQIKYFQSRPLSNSNSLKSSISHVCYKRERSEREGTRKWVVKLSCKYVCVPGPPSFPHSVLATSQSTRQQTPRFRPGHPRLLAMSSLARFLFPRQTIHKSRCGFTYDS